MNNKKSLASLLLVLFFNSIFCQSIDVKGFYYYLEDFNVNGPEFFIDESMEINASWDLSYNPEMETSYVQLHLFKNSSSILWQSEVMKNQGQKMGNWSVLLSEVIRNQLNESAVYYVGFYYYYYNSFTQNEIALYVEKIAINVKKKEINFELDGFTPSLEWGRDYNFTIQFFSSGDVIKNENFLVNHYCEDLVMSEKILVSNATGHLFVFLDRLDLKVGKNIIAISVLNETKYVSPQFRFTLEVFIKSSVSGGGSAEGSSESIPGGSLPKVNETGGTSTTNETEEEKFNEGDDQEISKILLENSSSYLIPLPFVVIMVFIIIRKKGHNKVKNIFELEFSC